MRWLLIAALSAQAFSGSNLLKWSNGEPPLRVISFPCPITETVLSTTKVTHCADISKKMVLEGDWDGFTLCKKLVNGESCVQVADIFPTREPPYER